MKAKTPPAADTWGRDWSVGARVWIERQGQSILGEGRADLLEAIDKVHSISEAARQQGISYRHAWEMVQAVNEAAGEPFVESATGGKRGGGATLTPRGREAVRIFRALHAEMQNAAANTLTRVLQPSDATPLHLMAAISLQETVGQLLTQYALVRPTVPVRAIFGASNELADYLLSGTAADLFLSADVHQLNRLKEKDLLANRSRKVLATNRLVAIAVGAEVPRVRKPADLLGPAVSRIVLADPACPLGRYTREYLQASKVYADVRKRAVLVDNSRGVVAAVKSGAAPVGWAFKSDALQAEGVRILFETGADAPPIEYAAAVIRTGRQADEAQRLLDFLTTPAAAACFSRCGLQPHRPAARRRPKT